MAERIRLDFGHHSAPAGANTGLVVVTVNGVASSGLVFTYNPVIASLSPASGPVGELVIISGQHFGSAQGNGSVVLGTLAGQVVLWTDTQIQAKIASGSVTGVVQVTQGGNASNSLAFAVLPLYNSNFNNSNELTSTASASFTYDNNGNITSRSDANGTTNYTWDFENRLSSVLLPGTGGTVTFKYDPFGRRIEKVSSTATTIYAYDGDNIVEELNGSGSPVAQYTQGPGIDEPLAMNRASATSFYQADGLGSVTSLTNGSGQIAASYTYDSFGTLTASTGTISNPFRFTARDFDSETGLYYYRARYYDPVSGRFLSEDPIGFSGGFNFYSYVENDPVGLIDPSGLRSIDPRLLDRARILLSNKECAEFLKMLLVTLRLAPNLDDLLHAFNETEFLPTPKGDPFVRKNGHGYTAHVDEYGASHIVHVDIPSRENAPATLLHEVLHTINYGFSDYVLAHAVGYKGPNAMKPASDYFSQQIEQHCKECKK